MNSKEQDRLINELRNNIDIDKNLKIVNSLISSANAWDRIVKYIENENTAKELYQKISAELNADQCFGYATHIVSFIDELANKFNENMEDAYKKIYSDTFFDDFGKINDAIETLVTIKDKMKLKY